MKSDRATRDCGADNVTDGTLVSLADLRHGGVARVARLEGGHRACQRMRMVGIRPGVDVRMLHGPDRKGAVVRVGGTRIALGRGVLTSIKVVPPGAPDGR